MKQKKLQHGCDAEKQNEFVTVVYRHSQLYGQTFKVVHVDAHSDEILIVELLDGSLCKLARSWTELSRKQEHNLSAEPGLLLDPDGLRRMIAVIDRMKREGGSPDSGTLHERDAAEAA
jgi:hypothetical protein